MLTLLSLLGSGLISVLPGIMGVATRWLDAKKDVQLAQIQADLQRTSMETGKAMAVLTAETTETAALLADDHQAPGTVFWGAVRASIRPVITYLFVGLFVAAKIVILYHLTTVRGVDVAIAMSQVWDETATAILAAVVAFWFGSRLLDKTVIISRPLPKR
jgi:hypothetical protein